MSLNAITIGVKNILMECHEREMLGQEPMNPQDLKYSEGFYTRGLIELRYYHCVDGRPKAGFYVTQKAKKLLKLYVETKSKQ
jgi:hypothetical protein